MRVLGLDGGIASVGWALIDVPEEGGEGAVIACGSRCFDAPETDKERTPTNQIRRQKRAMRRVVRRRRQRMAKVRGILHRHELLADDGREALALGVDPWEARAAGLERALSGPEFAAVLGHIAVHRGFKSNSKRDRGANAADDSSKMLSAIAATRERLGQWLTVGKMFARDPAFATRKRNRTGDYSRSILRDDQAAEVRALFAAQRRIGNVQASEALESEFVETAFFQRPLQDSDALVGPCQFEPGERRGARRGYSYELFRLLSRLNALTLAWRGGERRLTADEIALLGRDFGKDKKISFTAARKVLGLDASVRFDGIKPEDEKHDVVARSGNAAEGTYALRKALGADWAGLAARPEVLDAMAEVITFRDDMDSIRAGLLASGAPEAAADAVMAAVERGAFTAFQGAGRISAKAARAIMPGLWRGMVYSEACAEAGYDHAARSSVGVADIRNPIARTALAEIMRQVRAVVETYGLPERMHVELARDVGKSAEERDEITRGIEKKNKERDRTRGRFAELLGRAPRGEDMLRFELWEQQNGRCLYTDEEIPVRLVSASENGAQIDHILPWSRFGDDSFINKTLCLAKANQEKLGRTPWEWFAADKTPDEWEAYAARVESCKSMKGAKKRGFYLRKNAAEVEERFRNRNLGDTRYATRVALDLLARMYPDDGKKHVLARPGALTSKLRRGWGLQGLKKGTDGKRIEDDRHHALDAIVLAATTESMVNGLTRAFQDAERKGLRREFAGEFVEAPWPGFRLDAEAAVASVVVARPERRKIPGEVHAATIKQVRSVGGADVVFVRKRVEDLRKPDKEGNNCDLARIPIPQPYGRIGDPAKLRGLMIAAIEAWWAAGEPKDAPPRMPNGDAIRKVRVATTDKVAVSVRGGTADRGDMARVDVFRETDAKGRVRFHLVPIYPHQIATLERAPGRAIVAATPETNWTLIEGREFRFRFSLYQNSLIEVARTNGEVITGYFKGVDRTNAGHLEQSRLRRCLAHRGCAASVLVGATLWI
ncbi:MAG: type II CRISPR RNA-guided endonuclease Cas9 [Alphaproteobacteria bacterium]|nr:type II CRISPR RNA-guided endonuclease Cas9 [Alphaproteobacteria bacterium]